MELEWGTIGSDIYNRLRDDLLAGTIPAGSRLREAEIAKRFGASRTPVREALRRLEIQGLLHYEPRRGMVVPILDQQAIQELYTMREVLHCAAVKMAAKNASTAEIDEMKEIIEIDKQRLDDVEHTARSNKMFHEIVTQAAHNKYLLKSLGSLDEAIALLGPSTFLVPGRAAKSVTEHEKIVAAIESGNVQAAEKAAREHTQAGYQARLKLIFSNTLEKLR